MNSHHSLRQNSLSKLNQPHELLILPERFLRIRALLVQSDANAKSLARIVETDVVIAPTLLKTANSSAYNPMNKPLASISKAIARLGLAVSAQISMSLSLLQDVRVPFALMAMRQFWAHSFAVSQLCLVMGKQLNIPVESDMDDLFMAGLFHDIGKLLIALHIDETYFERGFMTLRGEERCDAENKLYGLDHAEVGQIMLQQWCMPETLINIVACHHHPENHVLAAICAASDQFAHQYWESLQYVETAQSKVQEVSLDDIRAWLATSELLCAKLK